MGKAKYSDVAVRNADIVRRYVDGDETLQAIGDRYGLSRERVRQILVEKGIDVAPLFRARLARQTEQRILEDLRNSPPATICPVCLGPSFRHSYRTCSPECADLWLHVRFTLDEKARVNHRRLNYEAKLRLGLVPAASVAHYQQVVAGKAVPRRYGRPEVERGWMAKVMELRARRALETNGDSP